MSGAVGRAIDLPGMEVAATGTLGAGLFHVQRAGANRWWVVATPAPPSGVAAVHAAAQRASGPAAALVEVASKPDVDGCDVVLLSMELDRCGTWFTLANAGRPRPVVVRRAGWVDVRGHEAGPLGGQGQAAPADDRVGLGPGDALVLFGPGWHSRTGAGGTVDDAVLDALLDAAGGGPDALASALSRVDVQGDTVVVAVPRDAADGDPLHRVAAATGLSRDELDLPGYPLGDAMPDLWHQPPRPPRVARMRVDGDVAVVAEVRQLLRRLLASWRIEEAVGAGDIELLASEVTTNAIKHAGTRARTVVRFLGDRLRVEVDDDSPSFPVRREVGDDSLGGRGIPLVDALASAWGVEQTDDGKRVWFEVAVSTG